VFSPYAFNVEDAREIWRRISCSTLLMQGTESWASDPEVDGRATAFAHHRRINVGGAGHWVPWVHHAQLVVFLASVRSFLDAIDGRS
jgi:pimeloyl-ACP methyl ester carboxylesterase